MVYRALSVRQPHAERIASGEKALEFRSWTTEYRGPLLIVSSLKADLGGALYPKGQAVCLVELLGVMDDEAGYAWVLSDPVRVESGVIKGRLKLFTVATSLVSIPLARRKTARVKEV